MDDYVGDAEKALETGQSSFHKVLFTWGEVRARDIDKG